MHVVWGLSMVLIGLFMFICGTLKTNFIIYRMLVLRSRLLWGEGNTVHRFYQVTGLVISVLGMLWATGIIWS